MQRFHQHWDSTKHDDPAKPTTFMHIRPERQMVLVLRLQVCAHCIWRTQLLCLVHVS